MSAVVTVPEIAFENRIVLHDVSWEIYERLTREHENRSAPRFIFDNGELEICMPSQPHEQINRNFEILVSAITEEREIGILSLGSTTFKKKPTQKGVEPNCCFYVQKFAEVFGVEKIDLIKFPPDFVIEVDVTSPSINRFPIYADFGVPEIWRYSNEKVEIFELQKNEEYIEVGESLALPKLTSDALTEFLSLSQHEPRFVWLKKVREWTKERMRDEG